MTEASDPRPAVPGPQPRPVILCVDDEPEVLRALGRDLRRHYGEHYRVLRADSGEAALEALRELKTRGEAVALIVSDQRMPGLGGTELLAASAELFPDARRVLLTAYADTDAAIYAINRSRVHHYLTKPWDPPEEKLYGVLDDLLEEWQAGYRPGFGGLRVVGSRWSPESHAIKDFLARNGVPYTFFDVERDPGAQRFLPARLPLVLLGGGERLEAPELAELARRAGIERQATLPFYDLAIVGGGPAGLAAAVYAASEGLRTVLVEREAPGGQAGTSSRIENYLGFPSGVSGGELARRAVAQAERFGVELVCPHEVQALRLEGPYRHLRLTDGSELSCHAVILSTGLEWQRLPARGAEALTGRGVYYGAALTEAMSCANEQVYIVGGGNSAGQAAVYFARYARQVHLLVRGEDLAAKMSQYLVDQIEATANIEVLTRHEIVECHGQEHLEALCLLDHGSGKQRSVVATSLFCFIGAVPRTAWLQDVVARDERGYVLVGNDLAPGQLRRWPLERRPYPLEASVPGVFAVGDVRAGSVKRVASAVGEGSVAVSFVHQHLASL
ncbi:thioredoxin reductase (NADPH) [Deinobacterium chartae]|uniref:Thioredoxin reductase (NADPH) n=1 Tax=Deinobacterium chartae TaxID=521158 RepID=A0A841HY23_9DEIO|nr:FAD-dependent oxidoreductase [Deinobacterium chartae]MBB6096828.1 thioredoxin reductase (NADPH) [Deinobacterium chartae]